MRKLLAIVFMFMFCTLASAQDIRGVDFGFKGLFAQNQISLAQEGKPDINFVDLGVQKNDFLKEVNVEGILPYDYRLTYEFMLPVTRKADLIFPTSFTWKGISFGPENDSTTAENKPVTFESTTQLHRFSISRSTILSPAAMLSFYKSDVSFTTQKKKETVSVSDALSRVNLGLGISGEYRYVNTSLRYRALYSFLQNTNGWLMDVDFIYARPSYYGSFGIRYESKVCNFDGGAIKAVYWAPTFEVGVWF
jgi:hypothetical protein